MKKQTYGCKSCHVISYMKNCPSCGGETIKLQPMPERKFDSVDDAFAHLKAFIHDDNSEWYDEDTASAALDYIQKFINKISTPCSHKNWTEVDGKHYCYDCKCEFVPVVERGVC